MAAGLRHTNNTQLWLSGPPQLSSLPDDHLDMQQSCFKIQCPCMNISIPLPPSERVREDAGQGEDDDGAEGRAGHVDGQQVGTLVHRRPKGP